MHGQHIAITAIAVFLLLTATTGHASSQDETPSSTALPTPIPSPTPIPTVESGVQIPVGWKRIKDDRLGYALAVPLTWLTFDLHSGTVAPIAGLLGGDLAVEILRDFLETPEGKNFGILAIEPDPLQLFANPPFPMFLNVSIVPWPDDISAEQLVSFLQNSADGLNEVELHSMLTGSLNGMPALQAAFTANLSSMGFELSPFVVVTVLRANQTAYILTIAARVQTAAAKLTLIEQIVGTFRPTKQPQSAAPPTALPTPFSEVAGVVGPGTLLVGIDIEPGVFVGQATKDVHCTWRRLNSLREDPNSIIAVDEHKGLFYVEILAEDLAFETTCRLLPIESVPARAELFKSVPAGMYMVGRDIAPGFYKGEASTASSCTWQRLNGLSGNLADVTSSVTPSGQYFVVVTSSDQAVEFGCPVEKVE